MLWLFPSSHFFMKLVRVLKIFLIQMFFCSHSSNIELCTQDSFLVYNFVHHWYSGQNTVFQNVHLFTKCQVATVMLLKIWVCLDVTLYLGLLDPEDVGALMLWNIGNYLPSDTETHPSRLESSDLLICQQKDQEAVTQLCPLEPIWYWSLTSMAWH